MDGVSSFFPTLVSQIVETVIALAVDMGQQNSPWSPPEVSQLVPPSILSRNFSFNSWGHSLRPTALVCPPFWLLVVFFLWFCGVHQVLTVLRYAVLLFFFREHFFCSHASRHSYFGHIALHIIDHREYRSCSTFRLLVFKLGWASLAPTVCCLSRFFSRVRKDCKPPDCLRQINVDLSDLLPQKIAQ